MSLNFQDDETQASVSNDTDQPQIQEGKTCVISWDSLYN